MSAAYKRQVLIDMCLRPPGEDGERALLDLLDGAYKVKKTGLWLRDAPQALNRVEAATWEWHPLYTRGVPALPFPFTAAQLAAFMWAGHGTAILEQFQRPSEEAAGGWHAALLDYEVLEDLGPNADAAREALRSAVSLMAVVPPNIDRSTDAGVRAGAAWLLSHHTPNEQRDDERVLTLPDDSPASLQPAAASAPVPTDPSEPDTGLAVGVVQHTLTDRSARDALGEFLQQLVQEIGTYNVGRVWDHMCGLVTGPSRPALLLGLVERDGRECIKWSTGGTGKAARELTRTALRKRLKTMKLRAHA